MEENTNLMAINFDTSGMMSIIAESFDRIITVVEEIKERIASGLSGLCLTIGEIVNSFIHCIASPREWHLMKYSKRRRIRKKYRDRLLLRLAIALDYIE